MTLASGTRLGPYEILAPLGAGGMGEVYRAKDARLGRDVAIKVLSERFAAAPEAFERFQREARTISQLAHPHICALYDLGVADGATFLVMELLEGETLADRLARGPVPLARALVFGQQIAAGLDVAHRKGIVHRDLKPGNVMLTASGVKLLDFGLARVFDSPVAPADLTAAPTLGRDLTGEGSIVGTVPYMAPEQLEGKPADARTDIFALGAVLYEMVTGRKAFSAESQASLISAILTKDPPSISAAEPMSPPALDRLVRTCLAKEPSERWQSAHDVELQLRGIAEGSMRGEAAAGDRSVPEGSRVPFIVAATLLAAVAWAAGRYLRPAPVPGRIRRLAVPPPEKTSLVLQEAPAISPDGRRLAFVAVDASGKRLLYVRALDSLDASPLADTDSASMPFWSPDGRSLGFFARGKLKTIDAGGGRAQTLCDVPIPRGGTWNAQGDILFVPSPPEPPHRISVSGGEPKPLPVDPVGSGHYRRSPYFLPDGRHYLYLGFFRTPDKNAIYVGSIDSKETRRLVASGSTAAYAQPGYLLFRRGTALMAQRFDAAKLEIRGEAFPVVPDVAVNPITLHTLFSVSNEGTLAYFPAGATKSRLIWFGRDGKAIGDAGPPGYYHSVSLSRDEKRVALDQTSPRGDLDVWILEVERGIFSRFTFDPGTEFFPIWSPDGSRIVFSALRGTPPNLYVKPTNGESAEEPLLPPERPRIPASWSADGKYLVFGTLDPKTKWDVWILPMVGDRRPYPFAATEANERAAEISPDGNWIAYSSDESGSPEVYVRPFPTGPGKWQVSKDTGYEPHWRGDGKELFYVSGDRRLTAAVVRAAPPAFEVGASTPLFTARLTGLEGENTWNRYAVTADGQRFLVNAVGDENAPVTVTLDWPAELVR